MSADLCRMLGLDKISWNMLGHFDLLAEGAEVAEPHLLLTRSRTLRSRPR